MSRLRSNFQSGTLSAAATNVATTLSGAAYAALPVVTAPDVLIVVLDPSATAGAPEIVVVTAHTASATTVTVVRGQEGTTARAHASGISWVHAPTAADFTTTTSTPTLPSFNIESYGAVANDITVDSTPAVNQALAAAVAAGGGRVLAPTAGTYYIKGALLTTGGCYAQIPLPTPGTGSSKIVIEFVGPGATAGAMGGQSVVQIGGQAIFHSTLTAQSYNATYGWPSVVGGPDADKVAPWANLMVVWDGIVIRQGANPSLACLNLERVATCHIKSIVCDVPVAATTLASNGGYAQPTYPTGVGVLLPTVDNNALVRVDLLGVVGYYGGFSIAEHMTVLYMSTFRCRVAIFARAAFYHLATITNGTCEWSQLVLGGLDPVTGATNPLTASNKWNPIDFNLNFEDIPTAYTGDWAQPIGHVSDYNNAFSGTIRHMHVVGSFGDKSTWYIHGGVSMVCEDLGAQNGVLRRRGGQIVDKFDRTTKPSNINAAGSPVLYEQTNSFSCNTSGRAQGTGSPALALVRTGTSWVYMTTQIGSIVALSSIGLVFRFVDINNYCLYQFLNGFSVTTAGVSALITTPWTPTAAAADDFELIIQGPSASVVKNGVLLGTVLIGNHPTGVLHGLYASADPASEFEYLTVNTN